MALIVPDTGKAPALHALVIGVNDYPNLGGDAPADSPFRTMRALTTSVPSALAFADWLQKEYANAIKPLGSLELLLSPWPAGAGGVAGGATDAATRANIATAFKQWKARCDSHEENIAVFYFCGHGMQKDNAYILPADIGDPAVADIWEQCINMDVTLQGMEQCSARTQCFFIDACRDFPKGAIDVSGLLGSPLLRPVNKVALPRELRVYRGASPGKQAQGQKDNPSLFTTGLLECLRKYGASVRFGRNPWWVTTDSLQTALSAWQGHRGFDEVVNFSMGAESSAGPGGRIHAIAAPEVLAQVSVIPFTEHKAATFSIKNPAGPPWTGPPSPDKWRLSLPPGEYDVSAAFPNRPEKVLPRESFAPPDRSCEIIL